MVKFMIQPNIRPYLPNNALLPVKNEGHIADRASFCQCRLRENSLKAGEDYSSIPNIIAIWICYQ